MKKLLVILLAFALVFGLVLTGCPNGSTGGSKKPGGEEPTPPPPPGGADPIEVEFSADNTAIWGGVKMEPTADGKGVTVSYDPAASDNSHGNAAAMFKVNLGENKVRDFEKVTFTFTGISGDLGPSTGKYDRGTEKGLNLLASASKDDMKNGGKDDGIVAVMVNKFVGGTAGGKTINESGTLIGKDQPNNTPKDLVIAIDPSRPKSSLGGEVWFCIYLHASAEKWTTATAADNPAVPTKFTITDLTFVPYETAIGDVMVNELDIPGVTAPVSGGTPVAKIGASANQYTGTVAWTPTVAAGATFADATVYTATITLTVAEGFTFEGVAANAFKVAGATATNAADTGVVKAVFPATEEPTDLEIPNPTPTKMGGDTPGDNAGDPAKLSLSINATTGEVTVKATATGGGVGFYYALPADWASYDVITVTYNATVASTVAKVSVKKGTSSWTGIGSANGEYKDIEAGTGKTFSFATTAFADMSTPGISFQINNNGATDIPQDWTITVTKITLSIVEAE